MSALQLGYFAGYALLFAFGCAAAGPRWLHDLPPARVQRWRRTASTVETDWINEVKGKGIDGAKLAAEARALIAKYNK